MNDVRLAEAYLKKAQSSKDRGLAFELSFMSYKNLMTAKRCYYTGLPLDVVVGSRMHRTIDRLDNSKGYVKGNVVACCQAANSLKSVIENPNLGLNLEQCLKVLVKACKRTSKDEV